MLKFFIVIIFLFFSSLLSAEDSLLTLKQKLDRLQREVDDISKLVFQSNRDSETVIKNQNNTNASDLTAFDLRIYDLEKDIKKLNSNFEELIFQIEDLNNLYNQVNLDISNLLSVTKDINQSATNKKINEIALNEENDNLSENTLLSEEKNTLGTIVINSEDLSNEINVEKNDEKAEKIILSPEEDFQIAFDLLRAQRFEDSKLAFINFINKYENNKLSGSAHYWLGELYLLKKEYREAALILAEGYQKHPKSIKAADMLYKLSEALISINKKNDSCGTLKKLKKDFPNHKLSSKVENKMISYECSITNE